MLPPHSAASFDRTNPHTGNRQYDGDVTADASKKLVTCAATNRQSVSSQRVTPGWRDVTFLPPIDAPPGPRIAGAAGMAGAVCSLRTDRWLPPEPAGPRVRGGVA